MKQIFGLTALTTIIFALHSPSASARQEQLRENLYLAYPPPNHQTTADKIFFIGNAPPQGEVLINDRPIDRSKTGNFAPSFPLEIGENTFTISYQDETIAVTITRLSVQPKIPDRVAFAENSLTPARNITRLPNESICFSAIAPLDAKVSVRLGFKTIPLLPQTDEVDLPPNWAIYTSENQKTYIKIGQYKGCTKISRPGNWGRPLFRLRKDRQTFTKRGPASVTILAADRRNIIEVIADAGVARTGPSTTYSRLTPLPRGTRATVTGSEGDWLRLDYGAWIKASETKILPDLSRSRSIIRSIIAKQVNNSTEIVFPLQNPVPVSVKQGDRTFTLTLHNTTAQTDIIRLDDNPYIKRLDWEQINPTTVEYTFILKSKQQWGYDLKYRGRSLVLTLRHPPRVLSRSKNIGSLKGIKILLDPGHGGKELGARGPTGYPEKEVNLIVAKLLRDELESRGAIVYMTREEDRFVSLGDRVNLINTVRPAIALSIHYNALPDSGNAIDTRGVGMFWYHPMAHDLAVFLESYLVKKLDRPSYGVFWNNLALTRPHTAPAVLLELGFMINPEEFEWISDPQQQTILAVSLADALSEWFATVD
ncbi:MAG: N-acetylmuramoyl-L-alanine amidase [Prochloraceae cyanobacterium]